MTSILLTCLNSFDFVDKCVIFLDNTVDKCYTVAVMTTEESLIKFGLDHKEAKIYLAALELGPATVLQISKKAVVKRPTAYVLLDKMVDQGYFSKTYHRDKLLYAAEKPEALLRTIRTKEDAFHEALPLLQAIMATTKERPKITIHEGKKSMRALYDEIMMSPEITFFGSIKDIARHFPDVTELFERIVKNTNPRVKDLLTRDPLDIKFARTIQNPNYEVRILPEGFDFSIDCAIVESKLAILAVKKDLFAVVIESKEVADSFRALHALAWQSATPIEKM